MCCPDVAGPDAYHVDAGSEMALTHFRLTTQWTLAAPVAVWDALASPEAWPAWWRAFERVELIEPGHVDGVGAYRRMAWRTALMRAVERPTLIKVTKP
jgi:uncharacterized protein YndB with AHSA1/START domain